MAVVAVGCEYAIVIQELRGESAMDIFIGAIVIGLFASATVYFKRRRSAGRDLPVDTSNYTLIHDWQVYLMVFLSTPAAIAGGDVLITHYFVAETHLSQIGLAGAWAALISNAATVAILFTTYKQRRSNRASSPAPVGPHAGLGPYAGGGH